MATQEDIDKAEAALRQLDEDEANWPTSDQLTVIIDAVKR